MKNWILLSVLIVITGGTALRAQRDVLSQPAPFWPQRTGVASGASASLELDALRALQLGLPSIAAELFQKLLDDPARSGAERDRIVIRLTTALLEDDRIAEAAKALEMFTGAPTPAFRLRKAMIAVRENRFEAARAEVAAISIDELDATDRGWLFFVQGQLADEARELQAAAAFYQQAYDAAAAAGLEAQRTWFLLARERTKLVSGTATERNIAIWRKTLESNQANAQAYEATSQLAIGLAQLGRRAEAVDVLRKALMNLHVSERAINDEWQLLLGLIAGADDSAGRVALRNLLMNAVDPDRQRIALRLLARAARNGSAGEFRTLLDQLISAPNPHPILEYLLLVRAQTAISNGKQYAQAENDANRLLAEFPNSPLKAAALGVLTESAWEQFFYRIAATQASRARAELKAGDTRAQLGVLVAEAYFRAAEVGRSAADYRTAADAYGAALAEVPPGVSPGDLIFQRVLSTIKAGQPDAAEAVLDEYSRDARLDANNRWQAEWNLARALQASGDEETAYARVNRLLENTSLAATLPPDLRVSMAWLQARLALENEDFTRALSLAETLAGSLEDASPELRTEIASNALLLQAQAGFALKQADQTAAALERLKKLRADFPKSDAAIYSYIIEADAAEAEGRVVDAQRLVVDLADRFGKSEYAPYALYRAALYAEQRAPDQQYYNEAYTILEKLVLTYPDDPLVFYARLKQGNLLRAMNEYGRARTLYANLVNTFRYPQFRDAFAAELALADTDATLAAGDPARAGNAASIYEKLYDSHAASLDLRAEAGHKLGLYRVEREGPARAYAIWWPMIEAFLLDDARAASLGANGRYWMARTVLELAKLQESQKKPQEARKLYELLLAKNLPGTSYAKEGLARTGGFTADGASATAP